MLFASDRSNNETKTGDRNDENACRSRPHGHHHGLGDTSHVDPGQRRRQLQYQWRQLRTGAFDVSVAPSALQSLCGRQSPFDTTAPDPPTRSVTKSPSRAAPTNSTLERKDDILPMAGIPVPAIGGTSAGNPS